MSTKKVGFIGGKFLPFHKGHEYAVHKAASMVEHLYIILSSSAKRDILLCSKGNIRYIPAEERLSCIGYAARHLENVTILHVEDDQGDSDYDWAAGAEQIKKAIGKKIDVVFSSEESYGEIFEKLYPGVMHVLIDPGREKFPISATEIRGNPLDYWEFLTDETKALLAKRIAIVGTESCGKSTLAHDLSTRYRTSVVPETGRYYCEEYLNQLTTAQFDSIAMEHWLRQQDIAKNSNKLMFVDSDAVITQYYLNMYKGGAWSEVIAAITKLQKYDLVLYLEPDVPWVPDGTRFAGDPKVREINNKVLKLMYSRSRIPIKSISGDYKSRFEQAVDLVEKLLR